MTPQVAADMGTPPPPVDASPRERLESLLYSLPLLSLRNPTERAVLKARCFKIRHLCVQILPAVAMMQFPAAEDESEVGLLLELSRIENPGSRTAIVHNRAKALEDLL